MFTSGGYITHWLGPNRGALVTTPDGKLYHVGASGKVERRAGSLGQLAADLTAPGVTFGEWRYLRVTEQLKQQWAKVCGKCNAPIPPYCGAAVDQLTFVIAVEAVKAVERAAAVVVAAKPKAVAVELSDNPTIEELAAYLKAHPKVAVEAR